MTHTLSPALARGIASIALGCVAALAATPTIAADKEANKAPEPLLVRKGDRLFVPADSPLRKRLEVAAVVDQSSPHEIVLPAVVEADPARTVNVLPPLAGKLVELKVRLGDTVKRGQLLATISSPDLAQAVSDAEKARDAVDLAERALVRARGVNEAGANAAKDIEAAQSNLAQQAAELRRSEARLQTLGASATAPASQALRLTAPADGIVTVLNVAPGANLNDVTAPLMTIANVDQVLVTVNVPEGLVGNVSAGQSVAFSVAAYPGRAFKGKVSSISAVTDPDTRRTRARIDFANAGHLLKPNMYASATVALPEAAGPVVPTSALLMNNDSVSVFVEVEPWTFVRRFVELGREDDVRVRIRSGLQAGERVVVRGGVLLND